MVLHEDSESHGGFLRGSSLCPTSCQTIEILTKWNRAPGSLDLPNRFSRLTKASLIWWIRSPLLYRKSIPPLSLWIVTMDASLFRWGCVLEHSSIQGCWALEESSLPIKPRWLISTIRAAPGALQRPWRCPESSNRWNGMFWAYLLSTFQE